MADWAAPNLPTSQPNQYEDLQQAALSPRLQHEVERLDSTIPFNPKTNYVHHTWAQTFYSRPEYYFQPSSIAEVQKIVNLARRSHKRVCVTGFGHSPSTLTLTSSWLINLDNLHTILEWDVDGKPGHVRFEAGISLHTLNQALAEKGFTLPNLGSIDVQSLAGVISTGTHGSSLSHGLISQNVTSIKLILSNGQPASCSATKNPDLFRAALLSLGGLGIIVEMTFQAVPDFNIAWSQSLHPLSEVLDKWSEEFWKQKEYTRVWWCPYNQQAVIWSGERTEQAARPPNTTFYGGKFGYYLYHNLLALSNYVPRILPFVEWLIFGMQYGFKPGSFQSSAVEPARAGLLMDCLYSQWVNEWTLPLAKGPEAITRLSSWINGGRESEHGIPFSSKSLWVHCPIEVRVSDTTEEKNVSSVRPWLDPTFADGPTLYLNATLYRPYGKDPPCRARYYEAFEWLMRELGGRPHWAKNFAYTDRSHIGAMYGQDMDRYLQIRDDADPNGMFLGEWHTQHLPIKDLPLTEREVGLQKMGRGWGDGQIWTGKMKDLGDDAKVTDASVRSVSDNLDGDSTPTTMSMTSHTSEESFDLMAKGEASVHGG